MRRWRLILILLPLLAAGAVAAGYAYLRSQDPDMLRDELADSLATALGREVTIDGALTFRLRPLPAVAVTGLNIGNPEWAHQDRLLSVERVDLVPSIPALLRGRVVIHRLELEGLELWLENGPTGTPNWQFPPRTKEEAATPLRIQAIDARDVTLRYFNSLTGVTRSLELDQLKAAGKRRTDPLEIAFTGEIHSLALTGDATLDSLAKLNGPEAARIDADLQLGDTRLRVDGALANADFRDFSGLDLTLDIAGRRPVLVLDWTELPLPEMRRFDLRGRLIGDGERLALRELAGRIEGDGFALQVSGEADDLTAAAGLDLAIDTTGTALSAIVSRIEGPWLETERFRLRGRLRGSRPAFVMEDLDGQFGHRDLDVIINGRIGDLRSGRDLALTTTVTAGDLGGLAAAWQWPLPPLDAVELTGKLAGDWRELSLSGLTGRLTRNSIEASVTGSVEDLIHVAGIDVGFEAAGRDLADLDEIFDVSFPTTDALSASGRVTGSRQSLDLRFEQAEMTRGDMQLAGSGRMLDLVEAPRLDLAAKLTGTDAREAAALINVEDLFETERFELEARVVGPILRPDVEDIVGRFIHPDGILDVAGRLPDVIGGRRIDLRPVIRGRNMAALGQLIGQVWPETDSYTLRGRVGGSWERPTLPEVDATFTDGDANLTARGRIGDLLGGRDLSLNVQARADSVTRFLPFGGRLWDRLGQVAGQFDLTGGPLEYVMDIGELTAGSSRLSGRFNLGFDDNQLTYVQGRLEDSRLDMTVWLESATADGAADDAEADGSNQAAPLFPDTPLPLAWMDGLTMDVDLAGNDLMIGGGVIAVGTGELVVENNKLSIDPFDVDYRGSDISGGFRLAAGAIPRMDVRASAESFDLGSLLRRSGLAPEASGRVDLQIKLGATGESPRALAASADGRFALLMVEGSLGRADVQLRLSQLMAGLVRRDTKDLIVQCGMIDLPVVKGVGTLNLFVIETQDMLMRGEGKLDFGQETMNVLLLPRPKRGRTLAHNANIRLVGPLRDPRQRIDATDTAATMAGAIGRFALLGPAGLFINRNTFQRAHEECAGTLAEVMRDP